MTTTTTAQDKTEVTINGKKVIGDLAQWTLREGVTPVIENFTMAPDDAKALLAERGPLTLRFTPANGAPVKVEQLWALNVLPGNDPWHSVLVLADRRWFWPYKRVLRRYNMRRKVSFKRILANDKFAVNFDRAPDVAFWKFSKQNGNRRWVALSMLQDMLEAVGEAEKNDHGTTFDGVIDSRIGANLKALPLEQLEIDDQGDGAMARVLAYLPEAGVTVDYDGKVIVFTRAGGDEAEIVKALLPEIRGMGHTDLVFNRNIRPKECHILFTREVEVRHNYIEVTQARGQTITADRLGNGRKMENVLPVPDYQLSIGGVFVPQGTWVTFEEAMNAWGNIPILGTARQLDHDIIQRAFIPHMDLWAGLQLAGQRPDAQGNLANWTGRIAEVMNNYRQTFRLNPVWVDNSLSIKPYRLATIDPQFGTRGPSRAYGDYAIHYSQRSIWRNIAEGKPIDFAINKSAYPSTDIIDENAEMSPAVVTMLNHDQGIVNVQYRVDPARQYEMILPSQIVAGSMPTADVTKRTRNITFDSVVEDANPPRLSPSFKLAMILTHIPAVPNDSRQLHKIVVKPNDIKDLLPLAARGSVGDAQGPPMEIRVGPNIETARIQWKDSKAAEIEKIFGITEGEPNLDGLVLNDGPIGSLETGASLPSIARAQAASVYASLVDRYQGKSSGAMNGNVHLNGYLASITHQAIKNGGAYTSIAMREKVPQFSLQSWLDSNSRAVINHLVRVED